MKRITLAAAALGTVAASIIIAAPAQAGIVVSPWEPGPRPTCSTNGYPKYLPPCTPTAGQDVRAKRTIQVPERPVGR